MKRKPQTETEWCAYRCQLSCRLARDILDGKTRTPPTGTPLEFAVFNLLHAVEELSKQIANAMAEQAKGEKP